MADIIIVPRRREDFFDKQGDPTLRFIRWMESVTGQGNIGAEELEDIRSDINEFDNSNALSSRFNQEIDAINSEFTEFDSEGMIKQVVDDISLQSNEFDTNNGYEQAINDANSNTEEFNNIGILEKAIEDIDSELTEFDTYAARAEEVSSKAFEIVNTTVALTTERNQIIICKNVGSINVTLDTNAIKDDEVHIKRRGDEVIVLGTIDGLTDITLSVPLQSSHLVFDGIDWSALNG